MSDVKAIRFLLKNLYWIQEPVSINPHEYCYCDDANEILCRLEIRQVKKQRWTRKAGIFSI